MTLMKALPRSHIRQIVGQRCLSPAPTDDTSKNSFWVALLTFGEGWHNNHRDAEYEQGRDLTIHNRSRTEWSSKY
jgi:fatty-acid desaturase